MEQHVPCAWAKLQLKRPIVVGIILSMLKTGERMEIWQSCSCWRSDLIFLFACQNLPLMDTTCGTCAIEIAFLRFLRSLWMTKLAPIFLACPHKNAPNTQARCYFDYLQKAFIVWKWAKYTIKIRLFMGNTTKENYIELKAFAKVKQAGRALSDVYCLIIPNSKVKVFKEFFISYYIFMNTNCPAWFLANFQLRENDHAANNSWW